MTTHVIKHHFHFPVPHFPGFVLKIFQLFLCLIIIGLLFSIIMFLSSFVVLLPLLFLSGPMG